MRQNMRTGILVPAVLSLLLAACEEAPPVIIGQLQSDRVELVAESNEPIIAIDAREGDQLQASDTVLRQDTARLDLQVRELEAGIGRLEAILAEQLNGPRAETIAAARVTLTDARAEAAFRGQELERLNGLRERNLTSRESVDLASRLLEAAQASASLAEVKLQELENGTRQEQLDQTRQQLAQSRVQLERLAFDRQRLTVSTLVAGVLDSLPYELGERPRIGDVVAVLLTGRQPLARVYIPETQRLRVKIGDAVKLSVDGREGLLDGRITLIANEASFTPYFALTENERGRLSYLAEITLADQPQRLPEGLPVQVSLPGLANDADD